MRSLVTVVLVLSTLQIAASTRTSYNGHKVYKFIARTDFQNAYLHSLSDDPDFDFWSKINRVGNPVSVMVSPKAQTKFEDYLKENGLDYSIEIENVESVFQAEKEYHFKKSLLRSGRISFDQYLRHSEINSYLASLVRSYSNTVSLENIGRSYEGRDMSLIRISSGTTNPAKPVIFVDAGIHAREWIAPATAVYLINQLVENATNSYLLEKVDWIILPVVNPDGYEFSWDSTRLWRKTVSPGFICNGCDGNRNFDFYWMEAGASSWECSETFAGAVPFSEVESRNLRDYILKTPNIKAYLTLHSYGQYLLYPWGWTSALPSNWQELQDLGERVNAAISSVAGTRYSVGSSTNVLYSAAGNTVDWAVGVAGINISYTIELPGGGQYGFDLPASRITEVVVETFEGFKVFADHIGNLQN